MASDPPYQDLLRAAAALDENASNREFDDFYRIARSSFRTETIAALRISRAVGVRPAEPRQAWATVLFTRICVTAVSIRRLLPDIGKRGEYSHWDFGGIAALCRTLIETHLFLFYFGIEDVPEGEWLMRKWLVDLHDAVSRDRFLTGFVGSDPDDGREIIEGLRVRLSGHPDFQKLPEKRQKHFLSGRHASFLTQDEILSRMEFENGQFRPAYEYLSAQTHSLPLSFHRMVDGDHGRGVENNRDKHQIAIFLTYTCAFLILARDQFCSIFPEVFPEHSPQDAE